MIFIQNFFRLIWCLPFERILDYDELMVDQHKRQRMKTGHQDDEDKNEREREIFTSRYALADDDDDDDDEIDDED